MCILIFQAAAITSDILETLGRDGHFTLFAPTNEAFEKLPRGVLQRIMGDKVASEGTKMSSLVWKYLERVKHFSYRFKALSLILNTSAHHTPIIRSDSQNLIITRCAPEKNKMCFYMCF